MVPVINTLDKKLSQLGLAIKFPPMDINYSNFAYDHQLIQNYQQVIKMTLLYTHTLAGTGGCFFLILPYFAQK